MPLRSRFFTTGNVCRSATPLTLVRTQWNPGERRNVNAAVTHPTSAHGWIFSSTWSSEAQRERRCYPPLIQFRRPLLHRADPCYHLCGDDTGTASSHAAISCGTLDDMKLEQKLTLLTGTRTFCTRRNPLLFILTSVP